MWELFKGGNCSRTETIRGNTVDLYSLPHHILVIAPLSTILSASIMPLFLLLHVSRDVHHCTYLFGGKATFVYVAELLLLSKKECKKVILGRLLLLFFFFFRETTSKELILKSIDS